MNMAGSMTSRAACLAKKCKTGLQSKKLSKTCIPCILFSLASSLDVASQCLLAPGEYTRFNGPGLVLLSKKSISDITYVNFHHGQKLWLERGYLKAKIGFIGNVICTHLSANLKPYFEFDTMYKSYEKQQAAEVARLRMVTKGDHILMGDLNTGPIHFNADPKRNIAGVSFKNYGTLSRYGYKNPYVHLVKLCTFCRSNPYMNETENKIIDHILFMGKRYKNLTARRVMETIDNATISDHYGVEARFCIKKKRWGN